MMQTVNSRQGPEWSRLLLWYLLLGAAHELAHVVAAWCLGLAGGWSEHGVGDVWLRTTVLRQTVLPALEEATPIQAIVIRHAGWLTSVVLFLLLRRYSSARLAAALTALEALSTDLIGWQQPRSVLFCGNFGIILLHQAWFSADRGQTALDILEKMVSVTMMRGAQSGGVITFTSTTKGPRGTRSRVVNRKRTDLSKLLRRRITAEVNLRQPIPFFAGHTRFATSSKATLEGTHPQQWTPPTLRSVYDMNVPHTDSTPEPVPKIRRVENYITHNGDFDFFTVNGVTYDLEVIQTFLSKVLGPMPAPVDSCAVAGLVDVLRTKGCFALSARYVICLGLPTSKLTLDGCNFPDDSHFAAIGSVFEDVLVEMLKTTTMGSIEESTQRRHSFAQRVCSKLQARRTTLMAPLGAWITMDDKEEEEQGGASLLHFCVKTVDAFFDNDLLMTTKRFLKDAKGSFGLCVTSSLDAERQICLAARGQTVSDSGAGASGQWLGSCLLVARQMSVAFYPNKGLICYGSEQAAVKAGLNFPFPGDTADVLGRSQGDIDNDALRLDLDDLGGEIILLDWGRSKFKNPPVSKANRGLRQYELMNGSLDAVLYQESKATSRDPQLYHRMTRLTRNRFIKQLRPESDDLILSDIHDIPKVCAAIQEEWQSDKAASSLNRLTAYNLSRCLRTRLEAHVAGTVHPRAIDILLTGCEVSLWLAEQFAADLQKSFPNLRIKAVSSNKLLGLYGQEIAVPALGFPDAPKTHHLHDTIIIIVSHSGGTFAPLSCSNLLQVSIVLTWQVWLRGAPNTQFVPLSI